MPLAETSSSGLTSRRSRMALGHGEAERVGVASGWPALSRGMVAPPPDERGPKGMREGKAVIEWGVGGIDGLFDV